ncbi:MAG: methyl-accepting chemotaxis protein [Bdellovibrionaceae bacterium]|nr:methyl-accepting chemotaxis protein [Pseudobdellovibrionaceae bacterium]
MLSRLSLKAKLISAFLVVASLLLVVGVTNSRSMRQVDGDYSKIADISLPNLSSVYEMDSQAQTIAQKVVELGLQKVHGDQDAQLSATLDADIKDYELSAAKYKKLPDLPGEEDLYKPVAEQWEKFKDLSLRLKALHDSPTPESAAEFLQIYEASYGKSYDDYAASSDQLIRFHRDRAAVFSAQAKETGAFAQNLSFVLVAAGFLLAVALGWLSAANIGNALAGIVRRIESGSDEVASAASQISDSSAQLNDSTTEQAAAIQETAASVDELTAMVQRNGDNAEQSRQSSGQSKSAAENGKQSIEEMIHSIEEISTSNNLIMQQVESGNKEMAEIIKVINEIGSKTKIINDIVFQTKLLSFNASVEAARAGEHGKGFAVVAEEIGNLAAMSGGAAKEITEMLDSGTRKVDSILQQTRGSVERLIQEGKEKVERGTRVAQECSGALEQILQAVGGVDHMISEIASASREQAQGIGEINKAMTQLNQVTAQNSLVAQQCASASEQLSDQAVGLRGLVLELNHLLSGRSGESVPAAPPGSPVRTTKSRMEPANVVKLHHPARKKPAQKPASSAPVRAHQKAVGDERTPSFSDPGFSED